MIPVPACPTVWGIHAVAMTCYKSHLLYCNRSRHTATYPSETRIQTIIMNGMLRTHIL